jgi:hypothetical protein
MKHYHREPKYYVHTHGMKPFKAADWNKHHHCAAHIMAPCPNGNPNALPHCQES